MKIFTSYRPCCHLLSKLSSINGINFISPLPPSFLFALRSVQSIPEKVDFYSLINLYPAFTIFWNFGNVHSRFQTSSNSLLLRRADNNPRQSFPLELLVFGGKCLFLFPLSTYLFIAKYRLINDGIGLPTFNKQVSNEAAPVAWPVYFIVYLI